jgi:enoyl-CoA hydratase/carnithine racemase
MENAMGNNEIGVSVDGHVATVEIMRPPNNFLDLELIANLASALEALDEDATCRSIVLAAAGKHFCAGANLKQRMDDQAAGRPQVQRIGSCKPENPWSPRFTAAR